MKQVALAAGAVALSIGAVVVLVKTRPEPKKKAQDREAVLVEVVEAKSADHPVIIRAQGTVLAAQQVDLQAEVSGRVVWMNDALVPGGRFKRGEALLRIDSRDYKVAVEQQRAAYNRARVDLEMERGRKAVAEKEWEILSKTTSDDGSQTGRALALREPQLEAATVGMQAARSSLDRASLDLERTTIRAPFNGFVQNESVDVGQLLSRGVRLGTLVGSDEFWVQVSVPAEVLGSVRLPRGDEPGSGARVVYHAGTTHLERHGRVIRLMGDVDPVGHMARLLVGVDAPMGDPAKGDLPLLLGSYVEVEVQAGTLTQTFEVPRGALRDGDRVFVMNAENKLEVRKIDVAWRRPDTVLVRAGLAESDRIVTSRVATPIEGMELRTRGDSGAAPAVAQGEEEAGAGGGSPQ